MLSVIGFDADDTLWHNELFYLQGLKHLGRLLSVYMDPDLSEEMLNKIDVDNIEYWGYGIKSFTLSMIETAIALTEGQVKGGEILSIIDYAKQGMKAALKFFEHVESSLEKLSGTYDLMLITKGDQFEQEKKIKRSGLSGYFRYIEIVAEKSRETYQAILTKYGIDPAGFLMVGNSLRSDILPIIEIGGRAVYIPYSQTWSHENLTGSGFDKTLYFELEHIGQLPELVSNLR